MTGLPNRAHFLEKLTTALERSNQENDFSFGVFALKAPNISKVRDSLGYAVGYLGGGLLLAFNVFMTLKPQAFGLADATQAVKASFADRTEYLLP